MKIKPTQLLSSLSRAVGVSSSIFRGQIGYLVWTSRSQESPFPNCAKALKLNRTFSASSAFKISQSRDRGPPSDEATQTDFSRLDVLGGAPPPTTAIDACLPDGFLLNNGVHIVGGSGCLLVNGEAFTWRPWEGGHAKLVNAKGQWECPDKAWGALSLVWPKPDLLILGLGQSLYPLSPRTRGYINSLGIRTEIQDTRNAAAQFNLLATERGVNEVAAALIPIGRTEVE